MRLLPLVVTALVAVTVTGCASSAPTRDEVAERFVIELLGSENVELADGAFDEVALEVADEMLDGRCGADAYRAGLGDDNASLVYAFDMTCLMYFESDMTAAQIQRAKDSLLSEVLTEE